MFVNSFLVNRYFSIKKNKFFRKMLFVTLLCTYCGFTDYVNPIVFRVKFGDNIWNILEQVNLSKKIIEDLLSLSEGSMLTNIYPETIISVYKKNGYLNELRYYYSPSKCLIFYNKNMSFFVKDIVKIPEIKLETKKFVIENSLSVSGKQAGLSYKFLQQLNSIYAHRINFDTDVKKGDSLSIIYESLYVDGIKNGLGNILAVSFVSRDYKLDAIRYQNKQGKTHYYNLEGESMQTAFSRNPVHFTRISSGFNDRRLHPVYGVIKPHRAIDYVAPINTPVLVTADGIISFLGYKNGYGKVIFVQHASNIMTVYAHLNRYNTTLKKGSVVKKGTAIGYVGMTGDATGPHLHYEFRVNGICKNPLTIPLPAEHALTEVEIPDFKSYAESLLAKLTPDNKTVAMQK